MGVILNVDVAQEATVLAAAQIRQKIAASILAQANLDPLDVESMLGEFGERMNIRGRDGS